MKQLSLRDSTPIGKTDMLQTLQEIINSLWQYDPTLDLLTSVSLEVHTVRPLSGFTTSVGLEQTTSAGERLATTPTRKTSTLKNCSTQSG